MTGYGPVGVSATRKVSIVGPESSGTRLMTRLIADLLGEQGLAVHRSVPYGDEWWPDRDDDDATHVVVITRNVEKTLASQERAGHLKAWPHLTPQERYDASIGVIVRQVQWRDWALTKYVTYERLVREPQEVIDGLAHWLGVDPKPVRQQIDRDR